MEQFKRIIFKETTNNERSQSAMQVNHTDMQYITQTSLRIKHCDANS